jgi:DNA topoisomerase VI subunit B
MSNYKFQTLFFSATIPDNDRYSPDFSNILVVTDLISGQELTLNFGSYSSISEFRQIDETLRQEIRLPLEELREKLDNKLDKICKLESIKIPKTKSVKDRVLRKIISNVLKQVKEILEEEVDFLEEIIDEIPIYYSED